MGSNVVFFGWNRSVPGREEMSAEHFMGFVEYLSSLQESGVIHGFDPVLLDAHGGDLNGFFLIRGESNDLDQLLASEDWVAHMTRASLHLDGSGAIRGVIGEGVMERMNLWRETLPA